LQIEFVRWFRSTGIPMGYAQVVLWASAGIVVAPTKSRALTCTSWSASASAASSC